MTDKLLEAALRDSHHAIQRAHNVFPDKVIACNRSQKNGGKESIGDVQDMEPDDALTGDLQEAQAAGNQSTDWRTEEWQNSPVNADGQMCDGARRKVEHIPETKERGHNGHRKDNEPLNGNRNA